MYQGRSSTATAGVINYVRCNELVLAIFGAGGQGKEVREIADYQNAISKRWSHIIFVDDNEPEGEFMELEMIKLTTAIEKYPEIEFVIAVGEPITKKKIYDRLLSLNCRFGNVISPDSQVSPYCTLGHGLVIKRGAIISPNAVVGDDTTIQSYACVGHDVTLGMHCQISTHAVIGGQTVIGDCVFVGLNSPIRELLHIGDHAIISAGAVVLKDVEANVTVMGNPARVVSRNGENGRVFH